MTPAEKFAKDMVAALARQPKPFDISGTPIAIVTGSGDLQLTTSTIPPASVPSFITWLNNNYVSNAP